MQVDENLKGLFRSNMCFINMHSISNDTCLHKYYTCWPSNHCPNHHNSMPRCQWNAQLWLIMVWNQIITIVVLCKDSSIGNNCVAMKMSNSINSIVSFFCICNFQKKFNLAYICCRLLLWSFENFLQNWISWHCVATCNSNWKWRREKKKCENNENKGRIMKEL
jgi:hypothetical protein